MRPGGRAALYLALTLDHSQKISPAPLLTLHTSRSTHNPPASEPVWSRSRSFVPTSRLSAVKSLFSGAGRFVVQTRYATLRFQTRALRFRRHARVQNSHRSSRFAWGNRGFSVGVGVVGFFGPKTAAEKMCKIPAISRALKKCACSGRTFRRPRRSGVGIRCFGGRRPCMGTRNGGFVTPAAPALVFGFIMTAKKLAFTRNPRMFPNLAHMKLIAL